MMEDWFLQVVSQMGLAAVGAYLVYFLAKRQQKQEEFIRDKLVDVINNNTKALESLVLVVNEMRHEVQDNYKDLSNKLDDIRREILENIKK